MLCQAENLLGRQVKMKYNRWYDKYPELKSLLNLLESIDEAYRELIAQDFLQIVMSQYSDQFDEVIKNISDNAPSEYSRWYDKDYNLHTCLEVIRFLDDNEKKQLINAFINALLSFVAHNDNE